MHAPAGTSIRSGYPWLSGGLPWIALLAIAIMLPVQATATWLDATYTTTPADLTLGLWILKASLATLAASGLFLARVPDAGPAVVDHATATRPWTRPALVVVLLLALGLRLYGIDTELWVDEIYLRTRYVPLDFRQLFSTYDTQNHQPLYSTLAKVAFMLGGGNDWALRVPAVLFGIASLWAIWRFGQRVSSGAEAVLAAFILGVSYHHVWFSQNARGYTAMLFFTVLATHAFLDLISGRGRRRTLWLYALFMALATWTHLTAALIAVGHAVALVLTTRWNSRESRQGAQLPVIALGLSALITVCLYAPMLPQLVRGVTEPTMEGTQVEWTGMRWLLTEGTRVLSQGVPGGLAAALVALFVVAVGVSSFWRQSRVTTLLMTLPIVVTLLALIATGHNLWPRFFFFAAGFLVLLALRGGFVLVRLVLHGRAQPVAIAGACAVGLLSLLTVPRAWEPKQQFRAAYEFVEQERKAGDEVVAVDVASWIYLLRGWAPTWLMTTSLTRLDETERSASRTWVVYTLPARLRAVTPDLHAHLSSSRYQVVRVFPATVGGGEIHILRHDSSAVHD